MHTEIILEKLDIIHFKGIKELHITFDPVSQNIWGDNGTGKTSIADAWFWLLFGKNSQGEADFGIKPLDKDNKKKEKTETDVTGTILHNGRKVLLRHVFKEVWQKKKGSAVPELTGNTHEYYIDNAPYTLDDFKAAINRMVDESIFPFVTNPLHFTRLKWQDQRKALLKIGGDMPDAEFAKTDAIYEPLIAILAHKTIDKYKQELGVNKKNIKEQLDLIPSRIDEVKRGMPVAEDYDVIQEQINMRNDSLAEIDLQLTDVTRATEKQTELIRAHQTKVRAWKVELDTIADNIRTTENRKWQDSGKELAEKKRALQQAEQNVTNCRNSIDTNTAGRDRIKSLMDQGREAWKKVNAEVPPVNQDEFKCAMCHQDLPADMMANAEDAKATRERNFAEDKARRLKANVDKGAELKRELTTIESLIETRQQELKQHEDAYDALVDEIRAIESRPSEEKPDVEMIVKADPAFIAMSQKIAELESEAPKEDKTDTTDSRLRKQTIATELDALKRRLNGKEQRQKAEDRIEELSGQEKDLAQQLVELEGKNDLVERFNKAKMDALSSRINGKFRLVKFKMFNYLQNGGVEDTCEVMVDGVPFSDLNTASRINAGIDIINVLCEHFHVRAPIFIDNRESVVRLLETSSQLINLNVKEGAKTLHVGKHAPPVLQPQSELALS